MHFSYAGITCYYAILVGESLAANSDRAKPRASSRSRQPFKGQLNASLAQGGSTKALKNNFAWNLSSASHPPTPLYSAAPTPMISFLKIVLKGLSKYSGIMF